MFMCFRYPHPRGEIAFSVKPVAGASATHFFARGWKKREIFLNNYRESITFIQAEEYTYAILRCVIEFTEQMAAND